MIINEHDAIHTWSHYPYCFSIIMSDIPDAVGAAGKPVGVLLSRLIACIHTVEVRSKLTLPRGHRRSTLGWCWYSGVKSWAELLIWAYSPPMGLYRAVMVEGLSIAHGREERRQFCPFFPVFISITLKDIVICIFDNQFGQVSLCSLVVLSDWLSARVRWDTPAPLRARVCRTLRLRTW